MSEPDIAFAALEPGGGERFQPLRRQLGVAGFGMNLIMLAPGQRGRIHAHERQEEVYLVLEGELTLMFEGDEHHALGRGQLARVGPAVAASSSTAEPERLSCSPSADRASTGRDGAPGSPGTRAARAAPPGGSAAGVGMPGGRPRPPCS